MIARQLLSFARQRERAYKAVGMSGLVAKSLHRIRNVAEYFTTVAEEKQFRAVLQLEPDIRAVLPSEKSRFQNQRTQILKLITYAKHQNTTLTT
jgi:hypothetical protein